MISDDGDYFNSEAFKEMMKNINQMLQPVARQLSETIAAIRTDFVVPQIDLSQLQIAWPDFRETFARVGEFVKNWAPNFADAEYKFGDLEEVIAGNGLPLIWTTPGHVVTKVMAALDRDARVRVLMDHASEIVAECDRCLMDANDNDTATYVEFGQEVIATWHDGRMKAVQALAVITTEAIIRWHLDGKYQRAKAKARFRNDVSLQELRTACVLAPIVRFYADWSPSTDPSNRPDQALGRHGTVHGGPASEHFTPENALLSIMLLSSLVRELHEIESL